MFDNILGQESAVNELTRDVENGMLPASLLFHGPDLSGKLTTALELARVLMCEKKAAAWNCDCPSCRQNRLLENPYLLLLGGRNCLDEIRAACDVVRRSDADSSRFLLVRAARKLRKRFDGVLWEGLETRIAPLRDRLDELEESIDPFMPGSSALPKSESEKTLEKIVELSTSISAKMSADSIPVHQVRKASYWAHTTTGVSPKVVLVNSADRMLPGSKNALLKILEEPPVDTYFILLTSNKEGITPTLKSRLRQFQFHERSRGMQEEILRRVFRETSGEYESLESYFLAWRTNPDIIKNACERFLKSLKEGESDIFFTEIDSGSAYLKNLEENRVFRSFLNELSKSIRKSYLELLDQGKPQHREIKRYELWNGILKKQVSRLESFNMNPPLLLHGLYREMAAGL